MLFSFNFQILLLIVRSFFTTLFNFLLSMSVTTSRCCNSQGMAFTSFKYFLLFLLTNTKSITVSFPTTLYVIFHYSFFSNHVFATHNSFSNPMQITVLHQAGKVYRLTQHVERGDLSLPIRGSLSQLLMVRSATTNLHVRWIQRGFRPLPMLWARA